MDIQDIQGGVEAATQGVNAISKLASTIGEIYYIFGGKSREVRQLADANAYASIVAAETENKVSMIKAQGADDVAQFVLAKESRKMQNTLNVVEKAYSCFEPDEIVTRDQVTQDWSNRFFSIVEDVSDNDLQDLWANILAGEVKRPKTYSLRTLDVLKNMTQEELEFFIKMAGNFMVKDFICVESSCGVSIRDSQRLAEMGIVNSQEVTKPFTPSTEILITNDVLIKYEAPKKVNINARILTTAGMELLNLVPPKDNSNFIQQLAQYLKSRGATQVTKHKIINWISDGQYRFDKNGTVL